MDTPSEDALFGPWLRRRRKVLDLTQKELARRVGCSPATIRKVEADDRHPSRHLARVLAGVLGVPEPELEAFVRFARGGWADRPPTSAVPDFDRPWLVGAASSSGGAMSGEVPLTAAEPANGTPEDEAEHVPEAPRIVARERELERLDRELEHALGGNGRVVLVSGQPGQGKTALMTAFAARAQAAHPELLVAVGTCNAYTGRGDPFLPFRQILAQFTGEVPAGSHLDAFQRERAARLTRAVPRAADILVRKGPHLLDSLVPVAALGARMQQAGVALPPLPATAGSMPGAASMVQPGGENQRALRSETAATLAALAEDAPLLLVLDDLHWLDDSSAELLLHLTSVVAGHRVLVLGAFRPADLQMSGSSGARVSHPLVELAQSGATTIDVGRSDGRAFVDSWVDREANALDEDFRAALVRQTGGHPLFTIELLRAMRERGDLVKDEAGRWSAGPDLHWNQVPDRIADALAARVGRLDAAARDVLRVASVEGEVFTAEVAARLLGLEPRQAVASLGSVLDRGHRLVAAVDVQRVAGGLVSRYAFRHNLIQRYVYDTIDVGERAYLHEGVASALEAVFGDDADPVALAYHYTQARSPERAARHYRKAGDRARRAHAIGQAIAYYQAALEHWPEEEPLARAALLRDLGECQVIRGWEEDAGRSLNEARDLFEAAGDVRQVGHADRYLAQLAIGRGDLAGAAAAARRAVAMLEPLGDSAELASALFARGYCHVLVAEWEEAVPLAERALAMAERVDAPAVLAEAMLCLGSALGYLDPHRFDESVALLERSSELSDEQGNPMIASLARLNLGYQLVRMGRYREVRLSWVAALEYARRHQATTFETYALECLCSYAWRHGDWSRAFELWRQLLQRRDGVDPSEHDGLFADQGVMFAAFEADLGNHDRALAMLGARDDALRRLPRVGYRLPALAVYLRAHVGLGRSDEADRDAEAIADALAPALSPSANITAVLEALQHLVQRSREDAGPRITTCLQVLERFARHFESPQANASLEEARALVAASAGAFEESAGRNLAAADAWQAGTFPLWEARARAAAAHALRRLGRDEEAESLLERAQELLAGLAGQIPDDERLASFARVIEAMLAASAA